MTISPLIEQHPAEIDWFITRYVVGKTSLLEIGSANGYSLRDFAKAMPLGSRIRSIDRPRGPVEMVNLLDVIEEIRTNGAMLHSAEVFFSNSRDGTPKLLALWGAPYDIVFIDGGHDYPTVKSDWESYGQLGKIVGFHDIAGTEGGPELLWKELKSSGMQTDEYVCGSGMGIGVVFRQ